MSKTTLIIATFAATMTTGIGLAEAHINLSWPLARYDIATAAQKIGPCGGGTATGDVTVFAPGEELTVTWNETVNHPGHFRIALDPTGADDFADPITENDMDVTGNVVAYVADDGGSNFQHTFTLPDVECDNCVLQVIQVMTDKLGNGYGGYPDNDDLYYWCADIAIQATTTSGPSSSSSSGGGAGVGGSPSSSGTGGDTDAGSGGGDQSNDGGCSLAGAPGRASHWELGALLLLAGALARFRRVVPW